MTRSSELQQARKTSLVVAGALAASAAVVAYRHRFAAAVGFSAAAAILALGALLFPSFARRFHAAWTRLSGALGYLNSRILLSAFYFLALAPTGFLTRMAGRDVLNRRGRNRSSYWVPRKQTRQAHDAFEHTF